MLQSIRCFFVDGQVNTTSELPVPIDIVSSQNNDKRQDNIYDVKNYHVQSIGRNRASMYIIKNLTIPSCLEIVSQTVHTHVKDAITKHNCANNYLD